MIKSMFEPAHTLVSNVNDTPISHISQATGQTLPLSSSNSINAASNKTANFIKINEPIIYKPAEVSY